MGMRRKSRQKLRKKSRMRGKVSITRLFQRFDVGEKVAIDVEPSFHKGMPHPRFIGKVGEVIGIKGSCYVVQVKDGEKVKHIVCHPVHLRRCMK